MNLVTSCQVLVAYKCYSFITVIFQVIKSTTNGSYRFYMPCNHAKAENTLPNNDLLDAWHYPR